MKKFLMLSLMSLVMMLTSCNESTMECYFLLPYYYVPTYVVPGTTNQQGQYGIAFSSYANGQTRATVNSESNMGYDDFSLYAWTKDSVVMDNWHAKWVSNGWTYVGVDNQQLKYFDNFVSAYNFIGVIPQITENINNGVVETEVESFSVDNDGTVDTPKEFLYATAVVASSQYAQGVSMNFKHGNAKVNIKFTSDDANTEIIDYYPTTNGFNVYTMTATTVPVQGPALASVSISDDDINYVNSHYTASKGFTSYQTNNVIEGDLSEDMYAYLSSKYPQLATANLNNWGTYIANANMRLVQIAKDGPNNTYRGVFVNVQNVNWSSYTVSGTQGVDGIVMVPATSHFGNGTDAQLATYPTKANVAVSLNGLNWTVSATDDAQIFTKPSVKITSSDINTAIPSPTTWYVLPCNDDNVGYTIKFSYVYKGVTVYDSRVFISAADCQWKEGKYYTYVIQINGRGNGKTDPSNIDADDPTISQVDNDEIKLFKVEFSDYSDGGVVVKEIK